MKSLVFPNEGALQVALTTGLVPAELAATPAGVHREADGTVVVFPSESVERPVAARLAAAGVPSRKEGREPSGQVDCWAQILPPRRTGAEPDRGPALFLGPREDSLLALGAEMLRLGCDRQDFFVGEPNLLRVVDPPYFTLAAILDRSRPLRAFVPSPSGQESVWTEIGFTHPLSATLRAPERQLLLLGGDGAWLHLPDGPWKNLYEVLELEAPGKVVLKKQPVPPRLKVRLRLAPASRNEPASLWVLRERAGEQLDRLLRGCSDEISTRLLFAASGDPKNPTVVLRARPGRQAPPELELQAEAYVPLMTTAQLYLPRDASLEPPLRREKLRELLAPAPDEVAWLARDGADGFCVEKIAESAFSPLADWVEYLVSASPALESWGKGATFEFEAFQSTGTEWTAAPQDKPKDEEEPNRERSRRRREPLQPLPEQPVVAPAARAAEQHREDYRLAPTGAEEQELQALQRRFVEAEAPADDPSRGEMWQQMATLHARVGQTRDTGLCWTRALWELPPASAAVAVERWARGEAHLVRQEDPAKAATAMLALAAPSRDQTRALAALVALTAHAPDRFSGLVEPHAAQVWLDANDDNLDVRSLWLARHSLARLVGGDRLGLARTRDRILAKLHHGLSLERDVPTFLRFLGQGGAKGGGALRLVAVLEDLLKLFEKTERKRSPVEAPPALTRGYVLFIFAYGFARLGAAERAQALRAAAATLLPKDDAIHGYLMRAYSARIDIALEGLPVETPLPAPIQAELNRVEKFSRYKLDRLRQASSVLEPQEHLEPIDAFSRGYKDPRGEEFVGMRGMTDPLKLGAEVDKLMRRALAAETPADESARLFDGLMDFFPILGEAQAVPKLVAMLANIDDVPPARRVLLLEEALMLSGFFAREELVREVASRIEGLLGSLSPEDANEVGALVGRCLRALRRVGLRAEAAHLLDSVSAVISGASPKALVARLNLAAGQAYLGHLDRATPEFERAQRSVRAPELPMPDRLLLTRACASALSQAPQEVAAAGIMQLAEQLRVVTDYFNTNSHFCLSVVTFVEALVLGLASEDLALGEFGRRWLDEEEYLVRRRVQRENAEAAT